VAGVVHSCDGCHACRRLLERGHAPYIETVPFRVIVLFTLLQLVGLGAVYGITKAGVSLRMSGWALRVRQCSLQWVPRGLRCCISVAAGHHVVSSAESWHEPVTSHPAPAQHLLLLIVPHAQLFHHLTSCEQY
jgi:hypothetical protein